MDFLKNNWFAFLCLILLILNIVSGYRRGFVRMLYRILCNVMALILAAFAAEPIGSFIRTHTSFYDWVEQQCVNVVSDVSGNSQFLAEAGVYNAVGQEAAQVIYSVLMFILAFILIRIIFWIIMLIAGGLAKAPVLRGINRFFGVLAGCFNGIFVIWILMVFFTFFESTSIGEGVMQCISDLPPLHFLYQNNPLMFLTDVFL